MKSPAQTCQLSRIGRVPHAAAPLEIVLRVRYERDFCLTDCSSYTLYTENIIQQKNLPFSLPEVDNYLKHRKLILLHNVCLECLLSSQVPKIKLAISSGTGKSSKLSAS